MENIKTTEIFVSDNCPFCKPLIEDYNNNPEKYEGQELINIRDSMANLKRFLKYRDDLKGYEQAKAEGRAGVPSKVLDGVEVVYIKEEDI